MSHIGKPPCDRGAIIGGEMLASCAGSARRWTLVAAIIGSSLAFIDGSVVNVALPAIQRQMQASSAQAQWVMESYALFLAALLLVGGALGDRFGRRRVFMLGVALFTASSIGCALASTVTALIGARALQGLGAAMLVPGSLALISAVYPKAERGAAIGTWSAFSGITAAIGPVVGGFLVDHYSWTWAFLINLPFGLAVLVLCAWKVPESQSSLGHGPLDIPGAAWITAGLAGVVFALIEGPSRGGLSPPVLVAGGAGVLAFALFLRRERRTRAPMLPLSWFRQRTFAGANLLTLLLYAALGGSLFFLPLNLIQVQGYGATAAGATLLPFIAIMFLLSRWSGALVDRLGSRLPLMIGPIVAAIGFALFALPATGTHYWTGIFPAVCVLGFGMAVTVAPLTTTVMNAVGADRAGTASGINNAIARTAGLLAIAVFGVVLTQTFNSQLAEELTRLRLPPEVVEAVWQQRQKLAGIILPEGLSASADASLRQAIGRAFVTGFCRVMAISALLALTSAICAWRMIARPPQAKAPST